MESRRGMGELEGEVLAQLWGSERPLTPREVRDSLGGTLAYTTVMTILGRLWEKGLAHRERRGRAYSYWPSVTEAELAAKRMRAALDKTADRDSALSRFADELSVQDAQVLRRVLRRLSPER